MIILLAENIRFFKDYVRILASKLGVFNCLISEHCYIIFEYLTSMTFLTFSIIFNINELEKKCSNSETEKYKKSIGKFLKIKTE